MIKLQKHQEDMISIMRQEVKGIIQAPTGTGKTFVQAARCVDFMNSGFNIQVVCTPRIGLTNQLAKEYIKYFKDQGITQYNKVIVHSGSGVTDNIETEGLTDEEILSLSRGAIGEIEATSFTSRFREILTTAQDQNIPLIIFSTYHSVKEKVVDVLGSVGLDIINNINDEAHYLTQEGFNSDLVSFKSTHQYFFTATPINSSSNKGRGMNNEGTFGKMIYKLAFREAVDLGVILDVNVKMLEAQNANATQDALNDKVGEVIKTAFETTVKEYQGLGAKLLVTVRDAQQLGTFIKSSEHKDLIKDNVEILTVHSNKDITTHNGKIISRKQFDELKDKFGSNPDTKMIIAHYDILSEGIDIPGLLSVLILRNLRTAKFMQVNGRVVRVYRPNPLLKTKGLILFPNLDKDMLADFADMFNTLINEYGYPIEDLREQLVKGLPEDQDDSILDNPQPRLNNKDFDLLLDVVPFNFINDNGTREI